MRRLLRRACVLLALRGGRGGGRLAPADAVALTASASAALGFAFLRARRGCRRACLGSDRRASRRMNQPIAKITTTPIAASPRRPRKLVPESSAGAGALGAGTGAVCVCAGGACCAGGSGENGLLPGAGVCAWAWAATTSAHAAAASAMLRRLTYLGGLAPPLPPPDADGGFTPPVPGSTLPPPPPCVPPPVPPDGAGAGAGAGAGVGATDPPLEPLPGVDVPESPDLFFFFEGDPGVVTPLESGVVVGWKVGTGFGFEPPPPDAIAITTMRKKTTTPPRATSLRRR